VLVYTRFFKKKAPKITSQSTSSDPSTNEIETDELKAKGDEFEKYITTKFDSKYFKIIDWRSDKGYKGNFPESNKYPDLVYEFNHRHHSKQFAIECKFRQDLYNNYIEIKEEQLINYRDFEREKNIPVWIAIGIGGNPYNPKDIFLLPLNQVYGSKIYHNKLKQFSKYGNFFYNPESETLS
jgi:hypothetical protein